jgi:hypothetical protein
METCLLCKKEINDNDFSMPIRNLIVPTKEMSSYDSQGNVEYKEMEINGIACEDCWMNDVLCCRSEMNELLLWRIEQ